MANNAASVTAGLFIINKIVFNQPSLRIPSYVKRSTITINPVRAHATREMKTSVEGPNVINDPKCNEVLNVITICPKCNKLLSCQLQ